MSEAAIWTVCALWCLVVVLATGLAILKISLRRRSPPHSCHMATVKPKGDEA